MAAQLHSSINCGPCSDRWLEQCTEPHCSPSIKELTAQCTDQCVVIACSDPNHPESICDRESEHTRCDLVCDEANDCTDCHGFDAFLQCCNDYRTCHPDSLESVQSTTTSHQHISWDSAFQQFLCECAQSGQTSTSSLDQTFSEQMPQLLGYPSSHVASSPDYSDHHASNYSLHASPETHHALPDTNDAYSQSSNSPPTGLDDTFPAICMWDACQNTFPSISELLGHVNTHLTNVLPTQSATNGSFQAAGTVLHPTPISCLWGDCNGSQSTSSNDSETLANHLLYYHLGLTPQHLQYQQQESLSDIIVQSPLLGHMQHPVTDSSEKSSMEAIENRCSTSMSNSSGFSIPVEKHSCKDMHQCRWKDCSQFFQTCHELTNHINASHIGSGKAHYECFWDTCTRNGDQGFQSKQKICRHIQSHTGHRPFQCTMCNQFFSEAATLQQHIRRHTQEKPYVCDYPGCGKSFAITGALTIHKRTHNGDKPFKCQYCDRAFAESSNLSKHLRTHTGARPYICDGPGCGKSFARPDQLNRHRGVHKKQARGVARIE